MVEVAEEAHLFEHCLEVQLPFLQQVLESFSLIPLLVGEATPSAVAEVLAKTELDVLVYVACNPSSLGRDRAILEAGHWRLERCWSVDLFPQTGHLEVVGRFVRR